MSLVRCRQQRLARKRAKAGLNKDNLYDQEDELY
jgi:hypothetical protein